MVLRPLKLVVRSISHLYWFRTLGLASFLLLTSCSALGFFLKRVLVQKLRWWIWRVILDEDMRARNIHNEAAAMAAATAVTGASSAAAQVACINQVMLTVQAEEKHQTRNIVSALQAVSLKFTKAELIVRGFVEKLDGTKELPAIKGMALDWHSSDKRYNSQWKASSLKTNCISDTTGDSLETHQPTKENSTFRSPTFLEVMAMLERGETPPGIKKINDKPPIPNQLPSVSLLKPKPKLLDVVMISAALGDGRQGKLQCSEFRT